MRRVFAIATLSFFAALSFAAAAEETQNAASPANPFRISFGDGADKMPDLSRYENTASPLTNAHFLEQQQYSALYAFKYHLPLVPPRPGGSDPSKQKVDVLPPPCDRSGHPLWFDGEEGEDDLGRLQWLLFARGQFDDLDALFEDWQDSSERMADGRWKLMTFGDVFAPPHMIPDDWDAVYQGLKIWRARSPSSSAAAVAEASYWIRYAWNARGTGTSDMVSSAGWSLYKERLNKALAVIEGSKTYAAVSPAWGTLLLEIGIDLNWSIESRYKIFKEVVKTHPNYTPAYFMLTRGFIPSWGGNWPLVERFAQTAAQLTKGTDRASLYARIYWAVSQAGGNPNVFQYTEANWSEIKQGFKDLMLEYPHSAHNLNRFAAFACMAQDKETYVSVRFALGNSVKPRLWPNEYSPDLCDHKFAPQPL